MRSGRGIGGRAVGPMKYGDLTYEELRERAADKWLAVIPTDCTEQQESHLPVNFDTWLAERITLAASGEAARKFGVNSLVLPGMPGRPGTGTLRLRRRPCGRAASGPRGTSFSRLEVPGRSGVRVHRRLERLRRP